MHRRKTAPVTSAGAVKNLATSPDGVVKWTASEVRLRGGTLNAKGELI